MSNRKRALIQSPLDDQSRRPARLEQALQPVPVALISPRRGLEILIILHLLSIFAYADVSKQELQKWVEDSALILKGTIVALDSNVDSIIASDNPFTVKVDRIEFGDNEALKSCVPWWAKSTRSPAELERCLRARVLRRRGAFSRKHL